MTLPAWLAPLGRLEPPELSAAVLTETLLANALGVAVLALLVAAVSTRIERPALRHGLWLAVLLRALMPPLVPLEVLPEPLAEVFTLPQSAMPEALGPLGMDPLAQANPPGMPSSSFPEARTPDVSAPTSSLALNQPMPQHGPTPSLSWADGQTQGLNPTDLAMATGPSLAPTPPPSNEAPWTVVLGTAAPQLLLGLWLVGSALVALFAGLRLAAFARRLRTTVPAEPSLQQRAEALASELGLRRCPQVLTTELRMPPLVWAPLARPRLVLPRPLLDRLSAAERDTVLAHELAHVARRDHWTRGLELITTIVFWWHPAIAWARRRLRVAEEQSCDEKVVELLPNHARAYAEALLETLDLTARPPATPPIPALASGLETRNRTLQQLEGRLSMILKPTPRRQLPTFVRLVLAAAVACALVVLPTRSTQAAGGDEGGDPARDQRTAQMAAEAEAKEHALEQERLEEQRAYEAKERALERERAEEQRAYEAKERAVERERAQERRAFEARQVSEEKAREQEQHAYEALERAREQEQRAYEAIEREQLALDQDARRMEERAREAELERHAAELEMLSRRHELANQALEVRLERAQASGDRDTAEQLRAEMKALQAEAEIQTQELDLQRERLATELEIHRQQRDLELEARRQLLEGDSAQREAVREMQRALEQRRLGRDQELREREHALRREVLEREQAELEALRQVADRDDVLILQRHEADLARQHSSMTREFALRRLQTSAELERLRLDAEVEAGRLSRDQADDTLRQLHQELESEQRGMIEHHIESQLAHLRAEIPEQLAMMRRQLEEAGAADTDLAQDLETLRQTLEDALGDP